MALIGLSLAANNPKLLAEFYVTALGFTQAGDGENIRLRYGASEIGIFQSDSYKKPLLAANDLSFQHFAIVLNDMRAAYDKIKNCMVISVSGPLKLPAASGGVTAYKFRDPENHPLELLQYPEINPPRIDHTAIVVADTKASIAFYADYGLKAQGGSLNSGPEQAALDALVQPIVEVTRLGDDAGLLHLELLCYRQPVSPVNQMVLGTQLIFTNGPWPGSQYDPDGHEIFVKGGT